MERTNNYLIMRHQAQEKFLTYEQAPILARWQLKSDEQRIFVSFFQQEYEISRATGEILRCKNGMPAGFEETLSIFDLLCYAKARPFASSDFAPINSLTGKPVGAGVSTDPTCSSYALRFSRSVSAFCSACETLGGRRIDIGDIGYEFPVFADLMLRLKFYEADDEFPPQLTVLFSSNALSYVRYETIFYIMNHQLSQIAGLIPEPHLPHRTHRSAPQ